MNDPSSKGAAAAAATKYHIDTARIYAGGQTEPIVGTVVHQLSPSHDSSGVIAVGTKAHPSQPLGLSPQGLHDQLSTSLSSLGLFSVDEFYLHQPDTEHSLLSSLQTLEDMITQQSLFTTVGMSNYHALEMNRAFELCDKHELTNATPKVYQGLYNPLNRRVEKDLLPVLRRHGCSFVAFNPLAAGLLTGKHCSSEVKVGRFKNNPNYLPRFYTPANFRALDIIRTACHGEGLTLVEGTFIWLLRHSALSTEYNDGLLLGASSMAQLEENFAACDKAGTQCLSERTLAAFDEAWSIVEKEGEAFPYWRGYSSDMPGRENLDQGASYSANKVK